MVSAYGKQMPALISLHVESPPKSHCCHCHRSREPAGLHGKCGSHGIEGLPPGAPRLGPGLGKLGVPVMGPLETSEVAKGPTRRGTG